MDSRFLQEAIRLSHDAVSTGLGGPFGAVVVKAGVVIGRGRNLVTSSNDPTAHAEIVAIRDACRRLQSFKLHGCELYCSCEPCPMCLAAICWAHLDAVYYANTREDAARIGFDDDAVHRELLQPAHQRAIRCESHPSDSAQAAFELWNAKEDRVPY